MFCHSLDERYTSRSDSTAAGIVSNVHCTQVLHNRENLSYMID